MYILRNIKIPYDADDGALKKTLNIRFIKKLIHIQFIKNPQMPEMEYFMFIKHLLIPI